MTNPNNYTTAYLYFATHTEEETAEPSIYDYVCEMEETPLDCESIEQMLMAYAMRGEIK